MHVARSHNGVTRVEVWSRNRLIEDDAPVLGGQVTEENVSGLRMTLNLQVEPSPQWLRWLDLPALEVRILSGLDRGGSQDVVPWGVFPVRRPGRALPSQPISIQARDRWQWVVDADFPLPRMSYSGETRSVIRRLVEESQVFPPGETLMTATSRARLPSVRWDKSRSEAALTAAESIGAEVFYSREGWLVVRNSATATGAPLDQSVILGISSDVDWSAVYNVVSVSGTNNDFPFEPVTVAITNPAHPAYRYTLGVDRVLRWASPLLTSADQARSAGESLLARSSSPGLSWTVGCIPDPSRAAGQVCAVSSDLGDFTAVTQKVEFVLGPTPGMSLTLGAV